MPARLPSPRCAPTSPGSSGIAERGPIDVPIPIESWRQFVVVVRRLHAVGFLAYAVRAFFENGGRRCWVVRVAAEDAAGGRAVRVGRSSVDAGGPVWRVAASSEGMWGDALTFTLRERNPAQIVTNNNDPDGAFSVVPNVSGFRRGTHVRCSSESAPVPVWKVVADVDPHRSRIYWVDPEKIAPPGSLRRSAEGPRPRRADRDP